MRRRRTARVYVFDPSGRVLLIRYAVQRAAAEFCFWLTPGGEIEVGETALEAARRELVEELGLTVDAAGPVYEEANQFEHQGEMRDNLDFYFVARCAAAEPVLRGVTAEELAAMREARWWSAAEIEASDERFFPADLVARVRQFAGTGQVAEGTRSAARIGV